jgi:hypothetical protein
MKMDHGEEFICGWLSGFFDGEGTILTPFAKNGKHRSQHLSVVNTDLDMLNKCSEFLNRLGIHHIFHKRGRMGKPHWKQSYFIFIYRGESVVKFYNLVGFISKEKKEKLKDTVEYILRDRCKYDREILKKMYWEDGMSFREISDHFGLKSKSGNSIKRVFDRYKIPRRDSLCGFNKYNSRPPKYDRLEVRDLFNSGMNVSAICRHYGLSIGSHNKFSKMIKG